MIIEILIGTTVLAVALTQFWQPSFGSGCLPREEPDHPRNWPDAKLRSELEYRIKCANCSLYNEQSEIRRGLSAGRYQRELEESAEKLRKYMKKFGEASCRDSWELSGLVYAIARAAKFTEKKIDDNQKEMDKNKHRLDRLPKLPHHCLVDAYLHGLGKIEV